MKRSTEAPADAKQPNGGLGLDRHLRYFRPGALACSHVLSVNLLVMLLIFVIDALTGNRIRLHILYVFPLALITIHCPLKRSQWLALGVSLVFQIWTVVGQRMAPMAQAGFQVTASIGFKTFLTAPETTTDALRLVDQAMYQAKHAGKSRVAGT